MIKKIVILSLIIISFISVLGCDYKSTQEPIKTSEEENLNVNGIELKIEKNYTNILDGLSVEWEAKLLTGCNTSNSNINEKYWATEEDFEYLLNVAKEMKLQKIRTLYLPTWIEPKNDDKDPTTYDFNNFKWNDENTLCLFKILDFCEENNVKVNITCWCAESSSWLGLPSGDWCSCPSDLDEYAENMCAFLDYLLNEKHYTCITELCPYNEPTWAFIDDTGYVNLDLYYELCKKLDNILKEHNLRDKIKLNLSDGNSFNGSQTIMDNLKELADIYNTHNYDFSSKVENEDVYMTSKALSKKANGYGAIHTFGEFGCNTCVGSYVAKDTDSYDRGLYISRFIVNILNGGSVGASYWCFFDQYYNYNDKMSVGLINYKDYDFKARPMFYSYSLLMKYTEVGSKIYTITSEDENVCAIAFLNTDNTWTYVVINTNEIEKEFTFVNTNEHELSLNKYLFSEETLPTDNHVIKSSGTIKQEASCLTDIIPANSMIVYSNK